MMGKKNNSFVIVFALVFVAILYSCKKEEEAPANPYDSVDYSTNNNTDPNPDPNSIQGLYKNIFQPRCANPGCHDGTFEPDFRTIESSYATLVYQSVNKVTLDSVQLFTTRAIPFNTDDSWLIERLTTLTTEYMPSNAVRLAQTDIDHVKNWINAGCPDIDGALPVKPNLQPNISGYIALDSINTRLDTNRVNDEWYTPFIIEQGQTITFAFASTDSADGDDATDPANYVSKKVKLSIDKNDFSSAATFNGTIYYAAYQVWLVTVPTSAWPAGTTVYFRFYVNDGDHTADAEFPRNASVDYYKTIYSFYVQ
ncbi:MAG TPA: hypothetical protein PLI47_12255 [Bacteroidia bacterium]|jgi:hypothetical protein|nr:hypothetical protein [Bacteroidota bacterium]MBP9788944.1 hypothetical protein [Bacteroidia bacterium]MBP9922797.1 hypothetical protein [Bacteroidia bacterium]HQW24067.1 hypothetical protein [Bacteroidia bacterium]